MHVHALHSICIVVFIRSARIGRRDVIKEKDMKKKLEVTSVASTPGGGRRRSSSSSGAWTEETDQYGLSQLFQPDNAPKVGATTEEVQSVMKEEANTVRTKFKVTPCYAVLDALIIDFLIPPSLGGVYWYLCISRLQQGHCPTLCLLRGCLCGKTRHLLPQEVIGQGYFLPI